MSTWHQDNNQAAIGALWSPHPTKWKCISDRHGCMASCTTFDSEGEARAYALKTGDVLVCPRATA